MANGVSGVKPPALFKKGETALEQPGRTMLDKIWDQHVIFRVSDDTDLLHVDRHLLHDLGGSRGLLDLKSRDLKVHSPELTFATPDHAISSAPGRAGTSKIGLELLASLRTETSASGIQLFDVDEPGQGIVHVIGPELGLSLPGSLIVCGDSHTCTHGGLGALAFGIGSSELTHVLATQTLIQRRPKTMRVKFEGKLPLGVTAKDMILALIGHAGVAAGTGYAVEYAGSAIRDLPVEGRFTICNLSIEFGAKMGMVAPDDKTYQYVKGRRYAPEGAMWERALKAWKQLPSDANAVFDKEITIDVTKIKPQVTWGISPEHVIGVDGNIPERRHPRGPRGDGARRHLVRLGTGFHGHGPLQQRQDLPLLHRPQQEHGGAASGEPRTRCSGASRSALGGLPQGAEHGHTASDAGGGVGPSKSSISRRGGGTHTPADSPRSARIPRERAQSGSDAMAPRRGDRASNSPRAISTTIAADPDLPLGAHLEIQRRRALGRNSPCATDLEAAAGWAHREAPSAEIRRRRAGRRVLEDAMLLALG